MFQKVFNGYIFCFLGHLVGGQLFELFARETILKKQSSVLPSSVDWNEYEQNASEWSVPGNKMEAFEASS